MLIHELSSGTWGKMSSIEDDFQNCQQFMETIKEIYNKHTKIPKKKLRNLLRHDLWWNTETCLKYGLVDEIVDVLLRGDLIQR